MARPAVAGPPPPLPAAAGYVAVFAACGVVWVCPGGCAGCASAAWEPRCGVVAEPSHLLGGRAWHTCQAALLVWTPVTPTGWGCVPQPQGLPCPPLPCVGFGTSEGLAAGRHAGHGASACLPAAVFLRGATSSFIVCACVCKNCREVLSNKSVEHVDNSVSIVGPRVRRPVRPPRVLR